MRDFQKNKIYELIGRLAELLDDPSLPQNVRVRLEQAHADLYDAIEQYDARRNPRFY